MSNKATTRWKKALYDHARKNDPSTHSHVMYGNEVICVVVFLPCHYCSKKLKAGDATVDHVIPKSKGGPNCSSNFVLACESCNTSKGSAAAPGAPHVAPKKRLSYAGEFKELLPPQGTRRLVKNPRSRT